MSPPSRAISLTILDDRYECSAAVIRKIVSTSGCKLPVEQRHLELVLEIRDRPQALDDHLRALRWTTYSTSRVGGSISTLTLGRPAQL